MLVWWRWKRCNTLDFLRTWWYTCGVMTQPEYSVSLFLMLHLSGLNFSPACCALSTVSKRWISWCSSDDPCTFTSSTHGNVPGIPDRMASICLKKISEDTNSLNGKCKKQYYRLLKAVSSWLCLSSCFVQYPLLASSVESTVHLWSCVVLLRRRSAMHTVNEVLVEISWIKSRTERSILLLDNY